MQTEIPLYLHGKMKATLSLKLYTHSYMYVL